VHASKKPWLLTERAWFLIQQYRMKGIDKDQLKDAVEAALQQWHFNLYRFVQSWR
jgi:LAO/AO transport system kinase